jgi:hypothetical protein
VLGTGVLSREGAHDGSVLKNKDIVSIRLLAPFALAGLLIDRRHGQR